MASRYGLELRRADSGDAAGLAELLAACGAPADARQVAGGLEAIAEAGGVVLVALEWGPPSGVIVLSFAPRLDGGASIAWATTLLVDPQARRRGIGRALLKSASQAARQAGCDTVCIAVATDEEAGRAFCLATGFAGSGEVLARPLRKRA